MITGINFNGKHSYKDFDMFIKERNIGIPNKRKITKTIPYMNGNYDFSLIYGEQCYDERQVEYKFNLCASSRLDLNYQKSTVAEWLMGTGKIKLYDDEMPGYYLLAECISIDIETYVFFNLLSCKFTCYPFYIADDYVGNDIWDTFNFEIDYATQNAFEVNGTKSVSIYNPSAINVIPEVICSSIGDIKVIRDNINYFFKPGSSKDYRFMLGKGLNNLVVTGNGKIEFKFRREIL